MRVEFGFTEDDCVLRLSCEWICCLVFLIYFCLDKFTVDLGLLYLLDNLLGVSMSEFGYGYLCYLHKALYFGYCSFLLSCGFGFVGLIC